MVPIGVGGHIVHNALVYVHNRKVFEERFEHLGAQFTRGYVAAKHGRAPRWWIRFREYWSDSSYRQEISAARNVLMRAGIDPWACGKEIYQTIPTPEELGMMP